jgi:uncharacterized delta-60 repeat protein
MKRKLLLLILIINSFNSNAQDGTIDSSFNTGSGFNNSVYSIVVQPNGKILVGGSFTSYNGIATNKIIRLNTDGSIDSSFVIGSGFGLNSNVLEIAIQTDGKILVGGNFASYNGTFAQKFVRLNSDGNIDNSFLGLGLTMGFDVNSEIWTIKVQPDGKILVGGSFITYNGNSAFKIIRLNIDGSRDNSFGGIGFGNSGNVMDIFLCSDGKILVSGSFQTYNSSTANKIIRLNTNGSIDTSFVTGTSFGSGNNIAWSIEKQSNDKIIVGGQFSSYLGQSSNRIVRLNADASIENAFNVGTGFSSPSIVYNVSLQPDNKILVGGYIYAYNGIATKLFCRLNSDGSIDSTFNNGNSGFNIDSVNSDVFEISQQPDGKILLGGEFTLYNGVIANRIIRLNNPSITLSTTDLTKEQFVIYPNPTNGIVQLNMNAKTITITDLFGKSLFIQKNVKNIDLSNLTNGIYFLNIEMENGSEEVKKIIKE